MMRGGASSGNVVIFVPSLDDHARLFDDTHRHGGARDYADNNYIDNEDATNQDP